MKLALISTPRSGNTWLRMLIAGAYDLRQFAEHTPDAIRWADLPDDSIVQIHWRYSDRFADLLSECGVQVLAIARHPLDVLLSILHFAPFEPQTKLWLSGEGGDESSIHSTAPDSANFLAYATGPRAAALLSVTPEWWCRPEVVRLRYEALVADPGATLTPLADRFGSFRTPLESVLASLTLENLRQTSTNNHFWKGQPGHWRQLMQKHVARSIAEAHPSVFAALGYSTDGF
jgi:hypothetical protein